jgi:hypothetical protein
MQAQLSEQLGLETQSVDLTHVFLLPKGEMILQYEAKNFGRALVLAHLTQDPKEPARVHWKLAGPFGAVSSDENANTGSLSPDLLGLLGVSVQLAGNASFYRTRGELVEHVESVAHEVKLHDFSGGVPGVAEANENAQG